MSDGLKTKKPASTEEGDDLLEAHPKKRITRGSAAKQQIEEENDSSTTKGLPKGWRLQRETVLCNTLEKKDSRNSKIIHAFDINGTLIIPASGHVKPMNRKDWTWKYPEVPKKLKELQAKGEKIVFIANQKGVGGKDLKDLCLKMEDIFHDLGFHVQVLISLADDLYRKPFTGMWELFCSTYNGGIKPDMGKSLYVGDAAGRIAGYGVSKASHRDYSVKDRKFANNAGLPFATAEEFFLGEPPAPFEWRVWSPEETAALKGPEFVSKTGSDVCSKTQEVVVFVGPPASGQTSFARRHMLSAGYTAISREELHTQEKCLKECEALLLKGESVIIDNTNPTHTTRKPYIDLCKSLKIPIRCFYFQASLKLCEHLSAFRFISTNGAYKLIPYPAIAVFFKNLEPPTEAEGFDEVCEVNFVPHFKNTKAEKLFNQIF